MKVSCLSLGCRVSSRGISSSLLLPSGPDAFGSDALLSSLLAFAPNPGPMTKQWSRPCSIDVWGNFDQGRSDKKICASQPGALRSEHPGTWSGFAWKNEPIKQGLFNLSDEIKIKLPGTYLNVHELNLNGNENGIKNVAKVMVFVREPLSVLSLFF